VVVATVTTLVVDPATDVSWPTRYGTPTPAKVKATVIVADTTLAVSVQVEANVETPSAVA
jgi:hypothetical protein